MYCPCRESNSASSHYNFYATPHPKLRHNLMKTSDSESVLQTVCSHKLSCVRRSIFQLELASKQARHNYQGQTLRPISHSHHHSAPTKATWLSSSTTLLWVPVLRISKVGSKLVGGRIPTPPPLLPAVNGVLRRPHAVQPTKGNHFIAFPRVPVKQETTEWVGPQALLFTGLSTDQLLEYHLVWEPSVSRKRVYCASVETSWNERNLHVNHTQEM